MSTDSTSGIGLHNATRALGEMIWLRLRGGSVLPCQKTHEVTSTRKKNIPMSDVEPVNHLAHLFLEAHASPSHTPPLRLDVNLSWQRISMACGLCNYEPWHTKAIGHLTAFVASGIIVSLRYRGSSSAPCTRCLFSRESDLIGTYLRSLPCHL